MRAGVGLIIVALAAAQLAACARAAAPTPAPSPSPAQRAMTETCLLGGAGDPERTIAACQTLLAGPADAADRPALLSARGEALCKTHAYAAGIADQDRALALRPGFVQALTDRAACDLAQGDQAAALASYGAAIALAPRNYSARIARARLEARMGDEAAALADDDAAIAIAPAYTAALDGRAWTLFDLGRFEEAAGAFSVLLRRVPDDPYAVLWRHIARARAHTPDADEFQAGIKPLRLSPWPGPLFDLVQGKASYDAVAAKAAPGPGAPGQRACEIAITAGEDELIRGQTTGAATRFETAASACDDRGAFHLTAQAELRRLRQPARPPRPA